MNLIIMVDSTTVRASPRSLPVPTCIEVSLTPRRTGIPHSSYEGGRPSTAPRAPLRDCFHRESAPSIDAMHQCRAPLRPAAAANRAMLCIQRRRNGRAAPQALSLSSSFSMRRPSSQCCHRRRCWRTSPPRSCRPWRRGSWPLSGWSGLSARRRCSPPCPSR